jgi:HEXXH motif-containing protein
LSTKRLDIGRDPWNLGINGTPIDLPVDIGGTLAGRLTPADKVTVADLREHGLHVITPPLMNGVIDNASQLMSIATDLETIVQRCVHEILVLKAPDDTIDVSHSEPRWPTRIFISLPRSSPTADLRVAEAIVHEAMHLNLTFLERRLELIKSERHLYSPWRNEPRPVSGVLHALYVFACISRFFEYLMRGACLEAKRRDHVRQRLDDIENEFISVNRSCVSEHLTVAGQLLVHNLFNIVCR